MSIFSNRISPVLSLAALLVVTPIAQNARAQNAASPAAPAAPAFAASATAPARVLPPQELLAASLGNLLDVLSPAPGVAPQTFSFSLRILKADGLFPEMSGQSAEISFQSPDRLKLRAQFMGKTLHAGRSGQSVWFYTPEKNWGVVGKSGLPLFNAEPQELDTLQLRPLSLEALGLDINKEQLAFLPLVADVQSVPALTVDGVSCPGVNVTLRPKAVAMLQGVNLPQGMKLKMWMQPQTQLPARIEYSDATGRDVHLEFSAQRLGAASPNTVWDVPATPGDKLEFTALSHLMRFVSTAMSGSDKSPAATTADGATKVLGTVGKGRLELRDGHRVLFLQGTPEEMGHQQGVLLKNEIRDVVNRILYGIGVGSSFDKGRFFFNEIEEAQSRLLPHMNARYLREMDAMAAAAGVHPQEVRLANFFPELFHCSGFALSGAATEGGVLYHGRILDYLKGVGLEQNAVVTVVQPDKGNAWVNLGYSGFIGSVSALNEKHVAIGEMGGRGEGNWDGKPMAQLVREVMEQASNLDEAVALMKNSPRTCEYYYVISDGKTGKAVGIKATPDNFQVVAMGEAHPELPRAFADAVLMSADERYKHLADRVQAGHGKIDDKAARDLMLPPVCMTSNIQSVLFAPKSLDFWIANADNKKVASLNRYAKFSLKDLLATPQVW